MPFLGDMVLLAGLAAAGVGFRRSPETHKRLMIMAPVSLLDAAFGRFGYLFPSLSAVPPFWQDHGLTDLTALAILLADWWRRRRNHPVFAACVTGMVVWHGGLFLAGRSGLGLAFSRLIVS